jgi:tetratricopeptide (TPR) repeat protein
MALVAVSQQAADLSAAAAHAAALDHTWALFAEIQNELGPRSDKLRDAESRVLLGLSASRRDPMRHSEWLRAQWFCYLLHDDHGRARDAIAASRAEALAAGAGPDWIATVTNELSYSLILLGEVAKAKGYLREAIVLASQRNDPSILTDQYYSIADAYRKTGEDGVARRYFEAARQLDLMTGDESRQVGSELRLGSIARDAGAIQEAVQRHERALSAFHREGNFREIVAQIELARDYVALRKFDMAEAYATLARRDRRSLLEQRLEASTLLLQIANDRRTSGTPGPGDVARASVLVREIEGMIAESIAHHGSEFSHPTRQVQFYEQAIRHYGLSGDLDKVAITGRRGIRLVHHVAAGLEATNDDALAFLSSAQPLLNEYVDALYRLDRSQVLPLLETYYSDPVAIAGQRHASVVGRAFETQAVELFERYRRAQQRVIEATAETERLAGFGTAEAAVEIEQLDMEHLLLLRDLARDVYLAMETTPPTPTLPARHDVATFQMPAVPLGDVLVRYFVQDRVSFGVVLAGGEAEYFDLPPRSEIVEMVRSAFGVLAKPPVGELDRAPLSSLAKLLPPDLLQRYAGASRLVIVADDATQIVPFAAIDLGDASQPYSPLVGHFELVRTKSASRYYGSPTTADHAEHRPDVVLFANPITARSPDLPDAATEARIIAQVLEKRSVKSFLGAAATSAALLSADARAAKVLHVATHGHFSSATPDLVGLETSAVSVQGRREDGFVGLTELFNRSFASRLVVISGCETMRGTDYRGWGGGSLADGFLTQGAGSVIGMLWKVSDDATSNLMAAFYSALAQKDGNSSLALNLAQREMIESEFFSHPYYWAGAVLESSNQSFDRKVFQ